MIQRVQSIYLLLVTILMSLLVVLPYGEMIMTNELLLFKSYAIAYLKDHQPGIFRSTIPVVILILLTGLISFVTIFLYNRRIVQIRLSVLNAILILILTGSMLYYYFTTRSLEGISASSFRLPMTFPVLAFVFCIMAVRYIQRDELLVNSYNRLR